MLLLVLLVLLVTAVLAAIAAAGLLFCLPPAAADSVAVFVQILVYTEAVVVMSLRVDNAGYEHAT